MMLPTCGAPFALFLSESSLREGKSMSSMTQKMSEAGSGNPVMKAGQSPTPRAGDRFRCQSCRMEIQVTTGCGCKDASHVQFRCCDQQMRKV
jgi:hypothetical protein